MDNGACAVPNDLVHTPSMHTASVTLDEWLEDMEDERDALIMRLRRLEKRLVRYGRLRSESLPRKMKR